MFFIYIILFFSVDTVRNAATFYMNPDSVVDLFAQTNDFFYLFFTGHRHS